MSDYFQWEPLAKVNDGHTYLVEMEETPENRQEKTSKAFVKGKRSKVKLDKAFGSSQVLSDQERLNGGKDKRRQDDYNIFKSAQLFAEEVINSKYNFWLQHLQIVSHFLQANVFTITDHWFQYVPPSKHESEAGNHAEAGLSYDNGKLLSFRQCFIINLLTILGTHWVNHHICHFIGWHPIHFTKLVTNLITTFVTTIVMNKLVTKIITKFANKILSILCFETRRRNNK